MVTKRWKKARMISSRFSYSFDVISLFLLIGFTKQISYDRVIPRFCAKYIHRAAFKKCVHLVNWNKWWNNLIGYSIVLLFFLMLLADKNCTTGFKNNNFFLSLINFITDSYSLLSIIITFLVSFCYKLLVIGKIYI